MMRNDTKAILDDLISRWHAWAKSEQLTPERRVSAQFAGMRSPRSWDSTDEVLDGEINSKIMRSIDFNVTELTEPYRTAIYVNARNCYTGKSVWSSPRLPDDVAKRAEIVVEARGMLLKKLILAGVI